MRDNKIWPLQARIIRLEHFLSNLCSERHQEIENSSPNWRVSFPCVVRYTLVSLFANVWTIWNYEKYVMLRLKQFSQQSSKRDRIEILYFKKNTETIQSLSVTYPEQHIAYLYLSKKRQIIPLSTNSLDVFQPRALKVR